MNRSAILTSLLLFAGAAFAQNPPKPKPPAKPGIIGSEPAAPAKPAAAEVSPEGEPPENTIARFFAYLQRKEVEQAYDQLTRGTKIAERAEDVKMLKSKTKDALAVFGAMQGYEVVATRKVGERLLSHTVISLGKDFPLRWRFYFYKPGEVWRLIDMRVDDRLAAMFDEKEEGRTQPEQ
jgi:hypothetical protein